MNPLEIIVEVWTPALIAMAATGGLAVGFFLLARVILNPAYSITLADELTITRLVFFLAIVIGGTFYIGQTIIAYGSGDSQWHRIVSRYFLWILYSACLSIGVYVRLHQYGRTRRARIAEQAAREIEAQ